MAPSKKFLQPINLLNSDTDPVLADIGDIYYNTVLETIRLYNGVQWASVLDGAIQVGQELYYSVSNNTGVIIPKGTVVYANGSDGEYVSIAPAIADGSIDPELFLGITTSDIQIGGQGYVAYFGKVSGVSGSLANGTTIYVSDTTCVRKMTRIVSWKLQRLFWVAKLKNGTECSLSQLPKEIVHEIIHWVFLLGITIL